VSTKSRVEKLSGALGDSAEVGPCAPAEMRVRYEDAPEDASPGALPLAP
jgi:hypothetical protein